jgi:hypothetical protein
MDRRHFLDKGRARFVAGLIGVLALTGLALTYYTQQQTDTAGRSAASLASVGSTSAPVKSRLQECREKRAADIANMLKEGVIDQAKHDEFLAGAMQTCAGMFPPKN